MEGDRDTTGAFDPSAIDAELDRSTLSSEPGGPPVLVVTRGPGAGSRYRLDREETRIGRHPEAHIFLDDVTVSRRHALIATVDEALVLTDQGSLNGTYVGGERLDSRVLVDGDEVQIGRFHLLYLSAASGGEGGGGTSADGGQRDH